MKRKKQINKWNFDYNTTTEQYDSNLVQTIKHEKYNTKKEYKNKTKKYNMKNTHREI